MAHKLSHRDYVLTPDYLTAIHILLYGLYIAMHYEVGANQTEGITAFLLACFSLQDHSYPLNCAVGANKKEVVDLLIEEYNVSPTEAATMVCEKKQKQKTTYLHT